MDSSRYHNQLLLVYFFKPNLQWQTIDEIIIFHMKKNSLEKRFHTAEARIFLNHKFPANFFTPSL